MLSLKSEKSQALTNIIPSQCRDVYTYLC